ncbi:MAG: GNAT family N-acetyltransferase [Thermoplasmata archaeon]
MAKDNDIRIEPLAPERLDDLIDAQDDIFADYIVPMKSTRLFFLDFLRSVGGRVANVMIALDGEKIVGYINPVIDGPEAWIGGVGVLPSYRGKGLGRELMIASEDFARRKGAREVSLEVIEGNDRAQKLYERLGYASTRKYLTAEGRPIRFEGFGELPKTASMSELLALHERAYKDTCWQRRKPEALVQSARGAECYKVDGGFVLVRTVETSGFIPFLGVVPEKRGKGIGTSLAKFALSRLYDLGTFKVALYNINEDMPTLRMLDKFDFKVTMKQIEMKKDLA